jgi:uncharacterized protein YjbJ (UPF0337 family)
MQTTHTKQEEKFGITEDWDNQSKKLKEKYSELTDSDLKLVTGKEDELITRLEKRLSKKREEVIAIIRKSNPAKS